MATAGHAGTSTTGSSRYASVAATLRTGILSGSYPVGMSLPSEAELMAAHHVSRGTARHALQLLVEEGTASIRRGARAVVQAMPSRTEQTMGELLSFSSWARSLGCEPSGRVVTLARRSADQRDAERLAIEVDEPVWDLVRVRLLDGRPVMVERSTYPHLVGVLLATLDLERGSISHELRAHGIEWARARQTLDAIGADVDDASLLAVAEGSPLLRVRRAATSPDGVPIEWGDDRYIGDAVAFVVENVARSPKFRRTAPDVGS